MPINRNALRRHKKLDECLRHPARRYYLEDLQRACTEAVEGPSAEAALISRRTVYHDLEFLKTHYGAEIEAIGDGTRRKYYRYADPSFSIFRQGETLSPEETDRLARALDVLRRHSGAAWVQETIQKIESRLGLEASPEAYIQFDENPDYTGARWLDELSLAIRNRQPLEIHYQDFKAEDPYVVLFTPYLLRQFNGRWFVFGRNERNGVPTWNLALDRIRETRIAPGIPWQPCPVNWDDHFHAVVGVTVPEGAEEEEVVLRVSPARAKYVLTKPLHGSQRTRETEDGWLEVRLRLVRNPEALSMFLSYGPDLKVLAPASWAAEMADLCRRAADQYAA
jgi:predicted DNA-binding transcriptional regulator YafY